MHPEAVKLAVYLDMFEVYVYLPGVFYCIRLFVTPASNNLNGIGVFVGTLDF